MNVRRVSLLEGAHTASGIAVVIDVFRAFTTAAFCIAAGAREIVLVKDPEEALIMIERLAAEGRLVRRATKRLRDLPPPPSIDLPVPLSKILDDLRGRASPIVPRR